MATRGVSLSVSFVAWDTANNAGKTGDSANIAMRWVKDGTIATLETTTVTEVDATNAPGLYKVGLSATETNCSMGILCGKSTTSDISIIPVNIAFEYIPNAAPAANGGLPTVDANNAVKVQSGTGANQIALSSGTVTLGDATSAGLAKFATVDTGETSAAAGSVAKLAQGTASLTAQQVWEYATRTITAATNITSTGGTITVSSGAVSVYNLTQAALALFATTDTGQVSASAGSVCYLAQGDISGLDTDIDTLISMVSDVNSDLEIVDANVDLIRLLVRAVMSADEPMPEVVGNFDPAQHSLEALVLSGEAGLTAQQVWEYSTRTLTDYGGLDWTDIDTLITTLDTVKGLVRSIMSKDEVLPEVVGTYDPAEHSLEMISTDIGDIVENVWNYDNRTIITGAGDGPYAVTITVNDDLGAPIQTAWVSCQYGTDYHVLTTDANGQCQFSLWDDTYTVAVYKTAYMHTPETIEVDETHTSFVVAMTRMTITPPASPTQTTGYIIMRDVNGNAVQGATLNYALAVSSDTSGHSYPLNDAVTDPSDANGLITVTLVRGFWYDFWRERGIKQRVLGADATTTQLPEILGKP